MQKNNLSKKINKQMKNQPGRQNGKQLSTFLKPTAENSAVKVSTGKMKKSCQLVSQILKALSHPQRLMILSHLIANEKTVGELVELCEISQSQMSQFLMRMKIEGLIQCQKQGRFQYYKIADPSLVRLLQLVQHEYC